VKLIIDFRMIVLLIIVLILKFSQLTDIMTYKVYNKKCTVRIYVTLDNLKIVKSNGLE